MNKSKKRPLEVMAVIFLIAGIILGFALAISSQEKVPDPSYLEKSAKYPYTYPIEDAPIITTINLYPMFITFGVSAFFFIVCYGLSAIIDLLEKNAIRDSSEEQM